MLELEELKNGEVYKYKAKYGIGLFRSEKGNKYSFSIHSLESNFPQYANSSSFSHYPANIYTIPSQEELQHFEACEKEGKFIPKEEIVFNNNEILFSIW